MKKNVLFITSLAATFVAIQAAEITTPTNNMTKIVVQATSPEIICVYIDDINELCVTNKKPKSLNVNADEEHRILAVNERGTISSSFFTLKKLKGIKNVVLNVAITGETIEISSTTPHVIIEKEKE